MGFIIVLISFVPQWRNNDKHYSLGPQKGSILESNG